MQGLDHIDSYLLENLKVCKNVNIELFNFYVKYFLVFLKIQTFQHP